MANQSVIVSGKDDTVKRPLETSTQAIDTKRYFCPILGRFGGCRRRNRCHFSHDENSIRIPSKYCVKFMDNRCLDGPNCRLLHSEPETSKDVDGPAMAQDQSPLLDRNQTGGCSQHSPPARILVKCEPPSTFAPKMSPHFVESPQRTQTTQLVELERPLEIPEDFRRRHKSLGSQVPWKQLTLDLYLQSRHKKCGICLEEIIEKRPFDSSKFSILERCDHVFCYTCIIRWRDHMTAGYYDAEGVTCPECRKWSAFIVAANYCFKDQAEKKQLVDKFFNDNCHYLLLCEANYYSRAYEEAERRERRRENARFGSEQELWSWLHDSPFTRNHSADDCFVSLKMIMFVLIGLTMWYIRSALAD